MSDGRPTLASAGAWVAFHQFSVRTYNETRKESRSICQHRLLVEERCQHKVSAPSALLRITHQPSKSSRFSSCPKGGPESLLSTRIPHLLRLALSFLFLPLFTEVPRETVRKGVRATL